MQELPNQLKELQDKGFIRPSSSPWEAPVFFLLRRKMVRSSKEKHEVHLKLILELLEKGKLFGKFSKCEFWLQEVRFLGQLVNSVERVKYASKTKDRIFSDYDCEIRYHPSKANVVADALSRKEWMKPRRVRALSMMIHSSIKAMILEA
ncbi:hypothetical protein Tco_1308463 [Tanacetum coccineum]